MNEVWVGYSDKKPDDGQFVHMAMKAVFIGRNGEYSHAYHAIITGKYYVIDGIGKLVEAHGEDGNIHHDDQSEFISWIPLPTPEFLYDGHPLEYETLESI